MKDTVSQSLVINNAPCPSYCPIAVLTSTVVNCQTKAPERKSKTEDEETDVSRRQTRFKKEGEKVDGTDRLTLVTNVEIQVPLTIFNAT